MLKEALGNLGEKLRCGADEDVVALDAADVADGGDDGLVWCVVVWFEVLQSVRLRPL